MAEISKREQVKALIDEGGYTKKEIAEKLEMSESSVSSQMTYLRWQGNFITYDEDKVLSLVSEEEFNEWDEARKANRKSGPTSTKTPEEQAVAVAKTIKTQEKQLANWEKKAADIKAALEDEPDNEELEELSQEADANIVLLGIKLKRNKAKAAALPEPVEPEVEDEVEEEADLL